MGYLGGVPLAGRKRTPTAIRKNEDPAVENVEKMSEKSVKNPLIPDNNLLFRIILKRITRKTRRNMFEWEDEEK